MTVPVAVDPVTGLVVRAVFAPAEFGCWAVYSHEGETTHVPVIAWADCIGKNGRWAGLLPVVPADNATGTIADPRDGFTGITFPGTAYRPRHKDAQ